MADVDIHQLANQQLSHLVMSGLYIGMVNAHLQENTIWARDGAKKKMSSREGQTFKINETEKAEPNQDPSGTPDLSSTTLTNRMQNGMTAKFQKHGYYNLTMNKYQDMTEINTEDAALAFDDTMEPAIEWIAEGSGYTRDLQARRTLMQAYDAGRSYVTTLSASPVTTLSVKNTNGFSMFWKSGVPTAVSGSNTIEVTITNATLGTVTRQVTDCTPGTRDDASDMIPGTITLSASVAQIAVGDPVISKYAPPTLLPNGRTTSHDLISTDKLTFLMTTRVTSWIMASGLKPHKSGYYHFTGDTEHFNHFWEDSVFRNVFQGQYDADEVRNGKPAVINNILFQFTQRPARNTNLGGVEIHRAMVTGDGALTLGVYDKDPQQTYARDSGDGYIRVYDTEQNTHHTIRKPLDAQGEIFTIAYKAYWGFAAKTDSLAKVGNHPNSPYKSGVLLLSA